MSACILWIDSEHANLFQISSEKVSKKSLKLKEKKHSNSHQDQHKHEAEEHFFHEIAETIGSIEELLIFGPGLAKNRFKTHLEKHHHQPLLKSVVGVEPLDHLTDNQILEAGRKFFKKYNLYNSKI